MDYDKLVVSVQTELLPAVEKTNDVCTVVNDWLRDKNLDYHDLIVVIKYMAMEYRALAAKRDFYKRRCKK